MSKKLVVGNWKMNPQTLDEAKEIASKVKRISPDLARTEAVVCPPFVFMEACIPLKKIKNFQVGSQSVSFEEGGAHTGLVDAAMLKNLGIEKVIIGHSEERERGDTNQTVSKKVNAALEHNLKPIVCVGEKIRDERASHYDFLRDQIKNSLENVPKRLALGMILAYEPVWAIGAKEPMKSQEIYEMSLFIKKVLADIFGTESVSKIKVLYGGAVNFNNAAEIISVGQVDGLLVGRDSVVPSNFIDLLRAVDEVK